MRRSARIDANHTEIVRTIRAMGCTVQDLAAVGKGCPDILVGVAGRNVLMEIKDGEKPPSKRRLTADQQRWHARWRGQVVTVESCEQVEAIINAIRGQK